MSSVALQRVLVRMLYDTRFAELAIAGEAPLRELDRREREWLAACDLRAFRIDPYRRSRSLAALLDEYPATCAWVFRHGGGVTPLDAFFSDERFHSGMQAGRSLAILFGEFLLQSEHRTPRSLAALELAMSRARREPEHALDETTWRLANGIALVELPRRTAMLRARVVEQLDGSIDRVVEGRVDFDIPLADAPEHFLVRRETGGGLRLEQLTPELHRLLRPMERGARWETLGTLFSELELSEAEAAAILDDFVASGELIRPS